MSTLKAYSPNSDPQGLGWRRLGSRSCNKSMSENGVPHSGSRARDASRELSTTSRGEGWHTGILELGDAGNFGEHAIRETQSVKSPLGRLKRRFMCSSSRYWSFISSNSFQFCLIGNCVDMRGWSVLGIRSLWVHSHASRLYSISRFLNLKTLGLYYLYQEASNQHIP